MKPPVEAPTSTQSRPAGSTPSSVEPVRELLAAARDVRRRPARPRARRPRPPGGPACRSRGRDRRCTSACACARDSASPRSTRRTSSRFFTGSVAAVAAEPVDVGLPAVDDVAEARTARGLLDAAKSSCCAVGLAREHAIQQRQELVRGPALERMVAELPLEVLVVRPDAILQREDRPQRVRNRLHGVEPGPVAERAVGLVDVAVERLADDRVPAAARQRLQLGDDPRELPVRLVEDDLGVSRGVSPVLGADVREARRASRSMISTRAPCARGTRDRTRRAPAAIGEHDADVPVRALVDHEVPAAGAEDVQPDDLLARARDLE